MKHEVNGQERVPLVEIPDEASALVTSAEECAITIRVLGGAAVYLRCPSARHGSLARTLKDIDVAGWSRERGKLQAFLSQFGYVGDDEFNACHGHARLMFYDLANDRHLDVFFDEMKMCHTLKLAASLGASGQTLSPTDLLLTKLQVVEINERDLQDASALLIDCEVDCEQVAALLASDWGWWRTVTENLDHVAEYGERILLPNEGARLAHAIDELRSEIEATSRSVRWRARARIGERLRWYQLPEESVPAGA